MIPLFARSAPLAMGAEIEGGRYRHGVAISLCVVYTFNFLDRQFLAILPSRSNGRCC
jgi:hypothetical protein